MTPKGRTFLICVIMKIVKFYDEQNRVMEMELDAQSKNKALLIYMEDSPEIRLNKTDVAELIDVLIAYLDKMEAED